jgi:DNA-binding NarL/FixJ family response regulator
MVSNQFINILLVEDHPLYREALVNEIQQFLPTAHILQASSIAEAFALTQSHGNLRLAILDLNLPDSDGLKTLLAIHQLIAHVPIAVISANENLDIRDSALKLGANVFINKSATSAEIRDSLAHLIDLDANNTAKQMAPVSLSVRQHQVLLLLAKGMINKEIAVTMGLADTTVRDHVTEILRRLEASNRTEAVIRAQQLGLLH